MKQCKLKCHILDRCLPTLGGHGLTWWMLLFVFAAHIVCGQGFAVERIVVLQDSLKMLAQKRDSLETLQHHLQASTDSLAQKVTRLKDVHGGGTASGDLALALRQSLQLTLVLEDVYGQEMMVRQKVIATRSALAQVYDSEIGRLVGLLAEQPDSGHISQIQNLRGLRQALAFSTEQRALPTVMIGEDDTPNDIRLKAELMADVALQIEKEKEAVAKQIKRLADEQRLRARGTSFTSEFGLFDDALPQGRSVAAQTVSAIVSEPVEDSKASISGPADASLPPSFDVAGIVGPPATDNSEAESVVSEGEAPSARVGREVVLDGLIVSDGQPLDELGVEMRKLQLYQEDLVKKGQKAQARMVRLRAYLKQLLEGQAP